MMSRRSLRPPELTVAAIAGLLLCWPTELHAQSDAFPSPLPLPPPPPEPTSPPKAAPSPPAPVSEATRYEPQALAQTKPLRVEVIDGSSFRDIETGAVYRLWGIDVCAPDQKALLGRQPWPCGTIARAWLVNETLGKWVSCNLMDKKGDELAVRCSSTAHPDIALAMLKEGVAVALPQDREPKQVKVYLSAQDAARRSFRGLWGSAFDMPWAYRNSLSSSAARAEAPPAPLPENPAEGSGPTDITGNRPSQAEGGAPKSPGLVHSERQQEKR